MKAKESVDFLAFQAQNKQVCVATLETRRKQQLFEISSGVSFLASDNMRTQTKHIFTPRANLRKLDLKEVSIHVQVY